MILSYENFFFGSIQKIKKNILTNHSYASFERSISSLRTQMKKSFFFKTNHRIDNEILCFVDFSSIGCDDDSVKWRLFLSDVQRTICCHQIFFLDFSNTTIMIGVPMAANSIYIPTVQSRLFVFVLSLIFSVSLFQLVVVKQNSIQHTPFI